MLGRLWPRFVLEACFLIGVAVVAGLLQLSTPAIVAVMLVSYLATVAVEWTASRTRDGAERRRAPKPVAAPVKSVPEPTSGVVAVRPGPALPDEFADEAWLDALPGRSEPEPEQEPEVELEFEPVVAAEPEPAPAPEPEPAPEPQPEPEQLPTAEPQPAEPQPVAAAPERVVLPEPVAAAEPEPVPEPVVAAAPEPEPVVVAAPGPEPEAEPQRDPEPVVAAEPEAAPAPPPLVAVPAAPEPDPEPELQPAAAAPAQAPVTRLPVATREQEWSLWELERLARERAGEDAERDVEWGYLLVYLREFASPDGLLPVDFDALVRESFADLIADRAR